MDRPTKIQIQNQCLDIQLLPDASIVTFIFQVAFAFNAILAYVVDNALLNGIRTRSGFGVVIVNDTYQITIKHYKLFPPYAFTDSVLDGYTSKVQDIPDARGKME